MDFEKLTQKKEIEESLWFEIACENGTWFEVDEQDFDIAQEDRMKVCVAPMSHSACQDFIASEIQKLERRGKEYNALSAHEKMALHDKAVIRHILRDWTGLFRAGKPVECTAKAVKEMFDNQRSFRSLIYHLAGREARFEKEQEEADAKN